MDSSNAAQQLVGAVFNGRWRLARLVGEGGMGAVYEAQSLRGEGVRAVKVLHPEFTNEEQVLSRFFAEAQAAGMLKHPNVAQVFESARAEDGTPYLVMEFLSGMPLSGLMKPGQPMPPQQAAPIVYGVLQALALAHPRGVVHRDLKPDNLFLVPDGHGNHVVKVLDFGIAKVMDAAGGMGSKTKTGILLGTPGYMSPEQIKNSKGVDARSDLWSVGIILYEMLTGREAFPADNEFTRLTLVLTQDITPIAQANPQLAGFSAFFQRALSKDPAGRFQTAQEMAQALMATVESGKSQSAQGREWGTVVLSIPQPPPGRTSPQTAAYPEGFGQRQSVPQMSAQQLPPPQLPPPQLPPPQLPPPQMQSIHGSAGLHVAGASGSAGAAGMQGNPNQRSPSMPPTSVLTQGQLQGQPQGQLQGQLSPSQAPPPMGQPATQHSGPSTHVSGMRPPGVPSLVGGATPEVPVMRAPPVGFPLWVVIVDGVAGLVVGFVVGAVVL